MEVKLLDCTMRDGGYLNDWHFGNDTILNIFRRLVKSNTDIVEIGFLNDNYKFNPDYTINPSTSSYDKIFKNEKKHNTLVSAMIDYGTCSVDNIKPPDFIDIIRVIFKQPKMKDAIDFCYKLKEKGYKIFVNPVSITSYSDKSMLDLIKLVNNLEPYAMSLVDTYGLLHRNKLFNYFYLLDNNLKESVKIGYHAHNNFQLAYSNAIEISNIKTKRDIILDSSLYGMGKSAGNCNTELLANYLNFVHNKNYDISEILNIIELEILKYQKLVKWGYQITYFLAGSNSCHPKYVQYLENKNMLRIQEINNILSLIEEKKKLSYDENYIKELFINYQQKYVDDKNTINILKEKLKDKQVLLIGPGSSLKDEYSKIINFINKNDFVLFSVNHINKLFKTDYIFISNIKRYDQFVNSLQQSKNRTKVIITSNINFNKNTKNYIVNYSNLISKSTTVGQSSLYMAIRLLIKLNVKKIVLAGFDGFSKYTNNYYDSTLQFNKDSNDTYETAREISKQINKLGKNVEITFLTKSDYQN